MKALTKNDVEYSVKNKVFNPFNLENMEVIGTVFGRKNEKRKLINEVLSYYPFANGIYCEQFHNIMAFRILN